MKKLIVTSLVVLGLTTSAFAQMAATPDFATADTNGDGFVSLEEAKVVFPGLDDAAYGAVDLDENGLSEEEFAALVAANTPALAPAS